MRSPLLFLLHSWIPHWPCKDHPQSSWSLMYLLYSVVIIKCKRFLFSKTDFFLLQPNLSSDSLPSTSNTCSDQTRLGQECSKYHTSSMVSGALPYGHQSYPDAPVSVAFTSGTDQLASDSISFLHPLPCHKFGFYTTTGMTSTVITHTASTMGAHGSVYKNHSYPQAVEAYSQTHCHSPSYPVGTSDPPVHSALPPVTAAHCLSVPEQVVLSGVRGKHKQKTGGVNTVGPSALTSDPQSNAPMPTSCLAKLLSTNTHEREFRNVLHNLQQVIIIIIKIKYFFFLQESQNLDLIKLLWWLPKVRGQHLPALW